MSRHRKKKVDRQVDRAIEEKMANRAAALGLSAEQVAAPREAAQPIPGNCLDEREFDETFLAKVDHIRSCMACRERFEIYLRAYQDRKNPIVLDFKPSAAYVTKLKEALNDFGIAVPLPKTIGKVMELQSDSVRRYVTLRTFSARSAQLPSFVLIENGEFAKEGRELLDGSLMIPPTEMGKKAHKLLAHEFIAWLDKHGGDLNVGHHVLKRLRVAGTMVIGYVDFSPLDTKPAEFSAPHC